MIDPRISILQEMMQQQGGMGQGALGQPPMGQQPTQRIQGTEMPQMQQPNTGGQQPGGDMIDIMDMFFGE